MAGIGFELRKLLKRESYLGLVQAYLYAGVISSGPWILSMVGLQVIALFSLPVVASNGFFSHFQTSVTFLIVTSMLATSLLQQAFTRYTADRLYERRFEVVLPNLFGVLFLITVVCGAIGAIAAWIWFPQQSLLYRSLLIGIFVVLCDIWIATIFLSGLREYKAVVGIFALGYGTSVLAALAMKSIGFEGLLFGFLIGQVVLLLGVLALTLKNYPSPALLDWDFLRKDRIYPSLILVGFFYNFGLWADKLIFWYHPATGQSVIGPIHGSMIYDVPITLACLTIIPGMAVFLVRMETDFVEHCQGFYDAIRDGASLDTIEKTKGKMIASARQGLFEIIQIQGIALLVVFTSGITLLHAMGISGLYRPLIYVDAVAVGLQVVFLGILNVLFYLDKRRSLVMLTGLFLLLNVAGTLMTLRLGLPYYGYGFALSLLAVVTLGFLVLNRTFERLEYDTFMLQ